MIRKKRPCTRIGARLLMLRVAILVCLVGLGGAWLKEKAATPARNFLQAELKVNLPL